MTQNRTPAGVPSGGEFASNSHDEARPLMVGYTYEERKDINGNPYPQMAYGEVRGAITNDEYKPLKVKSFRFENGERVVTLIPADKNAHIEDWEYRAAYLAQTSHILATVERVNNHRDWLRQRETPAYVVSLSRSEKMDNGEYAEHKLDVYFVDPAGIPDRTDGITRAVESAVRFEEYEDVDAYVADSGREYEDAVSDYESLREERDDLRNFLGEEQYQAYVNGVHPGMRYEMEEYKP